jgi:hypothetical protein
MFPNDVASALTPEQKLLFEGVQVQLTFALVVVVVHAALVKLAVGTGLPAVIPSFTAKL